jgi:hypothetical protein
MRYWLLRRNAPSIAMTEGSPGFVISSRRPPSIQKGDKIASFTNIDGIATFLDYAEILAVDRSEAQDRDGYRDTRVSVNEWTPLKDPIALKSIVYSLTLVHNLEKPALHFRRGYRTLPAVDFETIVSGEVFVSRSAYYVLLDALPYSLQLAFRAEQLLETPLRSNTSSAERLRRLGNFIANRVLLIGDLLSALNTTINQCELRNEGGSTPRHCIYEESEVSSSYVPGLDDIAKESALFGALRGTLQEYDLDLFDEQEQSPSITIVRRPNFLPSETRFEQLFSRTQ